MCLLIALVTLFPLASGAAGAQFAGVIVDYADPPEATEAGLFAEAVIVVRGRVEGRRMETAQGPLTSIYTLRILELLKSDGRVSTGGVMDVHRAGGLDAKHQEWGFEPFEIGDEVVLFLNRGNNGWYWPRNGPEGAFNLTPDGRTHAYGRHGAVSTKYDGRPAAEFMSELRKHKQ